MSGVWKDRVSGLIIICLFLGFWKRVTWVKIDKISHLKTKFLTENILNPRKLMSLFSWDIHSLWNKNRFLWKIYQNHKIWSLLWFNFLLIFHFISHFFFFWMVLFLDLEKVSREDFEEETWISKVFFSENNKMIWEASPYINNPRFSLRKG